MPAPYAFLLALTASLALVPGGPHALADAGAVPRTLDELWAGFAELDKSPLKAETLKEWEQDGVVCRVVRYQVGVFKGEPSKVAGFYAFPKGGKNLPGLLSVHGGGQSANLDDVVADAKRGYASLTLNWGGNRLNFGRSGVTYGGPQTDWGKLDATHPPQRNKVNHFIGAAFAPDEFTLDAVESPRNSNWFVVLVAARRGLTFLTLQPEVDARKLGVYGHSMGGKLTTNLAGIDPRVRAAVPSCGGSGVVLETQTDLPGCVKTRATAAELACVADNAYIPRVACPILWLSPTNDFNAPIDNMAWNWRDLPDDRVRFSVSPHFNHHHADEHAVTRSLWFDEHLKGTFKTPRTPRLVLALKTPDGVPSVTVTPDEVLPVRRVDVYYSIDPHVLSRFWRDARAVKKGAEWVAACPVMSPDQPLFVFANVVHDTPAAVREGAAGRATSETFVLSSRQLSAAPAALKAAAVRATDAPDRVIDDCSRGWHDWYRLNWAHPPLWVAATRKVRDPKWRGPDGAALQFEVRCPTDNTLVVQVHTNAWGAAAPGEPAIDYAVAKGLKGSPGWQTVTVGLKDLLPTDPKSVAPLANWRGATELSISPSGIVARDGQKVGAGGTPWQGPREIRNLQWVGGAYPLPGPGPGAGAVRPEDVQKNFDDAIKKSLEEEKNKMGK